MNTSPSKEFLSIINHPLLESTAQSRLSKLKVSNDRNNSLRQNVSKTSKGLHPELLQELNSIAMTIPNNQSFLTWSAVEQNNISSLIANDLIIRMPQIINQSKDVLVKKIGMYLKLYFLIKEYRNGR
jgi:hypothetical protein